jgi:hypothetical protein
VTAFVELAVGVILAAAATYFVLRPVLVPSQPEPVDDAVAVDPDDDFSARAVALRALKEIEFDRATGKLTDADYDELKRRYTAEALQALRVEAVPTPVAAIAPHLAAPVGTDRACPVHGQRPESDPRYCSECGRRLEPAAAFCSRCGAAMEPGARFCSACGRRVAA